MLHLKERSTFSYEAKDYPYDQWVYYLTYQKLNYLPKFSYDDAYISCVNGDMQSLIDEISGEHGDGGRESDQRTKNTEELQAEGIQTVGRKCAKLDIVKKNA